MPEKHCSIDNLRLRLSVFQTEYGTGITNWAVHCCQLAFEALEEGNYGVGAVLLDRQGECLAVGSNQVFSQGFNSAGHAEMNLLDDFEARYADYPDRAGLTLLVSLEPCPMCTARILAAGIGRVIYLVEDQFGGMLSHCDRLPDAWVNLSQLVDVKKFSDSKELSLLAYDIANAQISERREKLISIIRP